MATWNVLHGLGVDTGRVDLGRIATALMTLDADVIALQEVDRHQDRSGRIDQAGEIAQRLGYGAIFAPALLGSPETVWRAPSGEDPGGPAYGVAVLSRLPVLAVRRLRLPGGGDGQRTTSATPSRPGWDREPRVALQVRVGVDDAALTVTCAHLSYLPWRALRQRSSVLAAAAGAGASVVAGDFNLPAWVMRRVGGGWRWAGGGATHPSHDPRIQLDHILGRGVQVSVVEVGARAASDHLPLVAEVSVPARHA